MGLQIGAKRLQIGAGITNQGKGITNRGSFWDYKLDQGWITNRGKKITNQGRDYKSVQNIGTKENSAGFLKHCFILKMLGCLQYFFIAHNNGSVSSPVSQKMLSSFSLFNVFTMFPKNELKVSAIFVSSVKTLLSSTSVIFLFLDPFFSVKSGDMFSRTTYYQ